MTPDDLSAELDRMKERQRFASDASAGFSQMEERHAALIKVAYEDTPRLLAVVEAVLKEAGEWVTEAKRIDGIFAGDEDPWPRTVGGMRAEAFESCAAKVREAIGRELTGTQLSEDEKHG